MFEVQHKNYDLHLSLNLKIKEINNKLNHDQLNWEVD